MTYGNTPLRVNVSVEVRRFQRELLSKEVIIKRFYIRSLDNQTFYQYLRALSQATEDDLREYTPTRQRES